MKIFSLNPEMIQGIIFDIDLTLYDNPHYYESQEKLLLERLARELNRPVEDVTAEIRDYRRQVQEDTGTRPALGPSLCLLYGVTVAQISRWREEMFNPEDYLSRDERLIEVIDDLSKTYKIAAVTNNPTSIGRRTLKALDVDNFFSRVIGIDVAQESKPAIKPFNLVVEHFGCRHENVVSIGDRYEVDLELPIKHGMGGILVECIDDVYRLREVLTYPSGE